MSWIILAVFVIHSAADFISDRTMSRRIRDIEIHISCLYAEIDDLYGELEEE